jgi:soluble lytic murein transglycosylase-like protein
MKLLYIGGLLFGLYLLLGTRRSAASGGSVSVSLTTTETKVMSFSDIIVSEGYKQNMDPAAIAAVIHWESGGDTNAIRKEYDENGVNWATSYGLMQVLDRTADWLKSRYPDLTYRAGDHNSLYDPGTNIQVGTRELSYQFARYGRNMAFSFAGYNAGTCYVKELGYIKPCYAEQWGAYCSGSGNEVVNTYVLGVYSLMLRYRQIFNQIYANYSEYFNPVNFQ